VVIADEAYMPEEAAQIFPTRKLASVNDDSARVSMGPPSRCPR